MGPVLRHEGGASRPAAEPARLAEAGAAHAPGSAGRQDLCRYRPGDKVHARMADGWGQRCWSRFPWTVIAVATARDGGDPRITIAPPSGESRYTCGPEDLKRWKGYGSR